VPLAQHPTLVHADLSRQLVVRHGASRPGTRILAHLFTEHLGRIITLADLGYAEDVPLDLGLAWEPTARATVGTVAKLWRVDMERRALLLGSAWISTAFATPTREWLLNWATDDAGHLGGRRVGAAEIDVVWSMCHAFADADHRLGGGYAYHADAYRYPLALFTLPDGHAGVVRSPSILVRSQLSF
jgi:hypothetical protein